MSGPRARAVDYLLLGHVCLDHTPDGEVLGGTVLFAGRTAVALGLRAAIVTAAPEPERVRAALPAADVIVQPAPAWTRFHNVYSNGTRRQTSPSQAPPIELSSIPSEWLAAARIIHYAPIAGEIIPLPLPRRAGCVAGLTVQGLARRFEPDGRVVYQPPALSEAQLRALDAIVVSEEDVQGDRSLPADWARWVPLVALTQGERGVELWIEGGRRDVAAEPVATADPTGAGDLFAAMLFAALAAGQPPLDAADRAARFVADVLRMRAGGQGAAAIDAAATRSRVVTPAPPTGYNPEGTGQPERGSE